MTDLTIFNQFAKKSKQPILRASGKAVIYTRVSSKEQAENNASLETQKKYCEQLAIKKGIEILEYFGGTYESAKSDERKHFQRMLSYVKRKKDVGYIIVYSYDRFSRTGANGAYISDQLKKQGIVTISATQEVDTSTSAGSFQQNLYYMFSQFDNELRRDKCVSGMQEKLRKGYWTGAYPFGYDNLNPGNGKMPEFVVNEKGRLLREAFKMKVNFNMTHIEIAKQLNKKGLSISHKRLSEYFRNPFYCGLIVNNVIPGEVIEGKQESLISKELFLKVNGLLRDQVSGTQYNQEDKHLPLKLFIRSAVCGTPYTGYIVRKKGLYYYKNRRKGSKENRSAKKLHQLFEEFLENFQIRDKRYIAPLKEIVSQTFLDMNKEHIEESKRLKENLEITQKKIERLEERFVFEEISKDQYDKFLLKLEKEKQEIESISEKTGINSSNLKKAIEKAIDYALNLPSLWRSGDIEVKRKLQYIVFPEGIEYDFQNDQFRTFRTNIIFDVISSISESFSSGDKRNYHFKNNNSALVESGGLEPPSKQVTK